jgi:hypothetical protein
MKKTRSDKSIEDYKKIKKKIKSKVKSVRKYVISKMFKNRNMKNMWHGVNTICGQKTSQTEDLTLLDPVNGLSKSDNKECADIFARAFKSKVNKLVQHVGDKDAMTDHISRKFKDCLISTQFKIKDIIDVVFAFKKSTSSGPDGISINYIKDSIEELSPVLKFIFDKAALFAMMPFQWKKAKIIPIHKKGKKDDPENYRPISLLCSIGKIFEKCVLNIISNSFGHSMPSSFQPGF